MSNGICFKKIAIENRDLLNAALAREAQLRADKLDDDKTFNAAYEKLQRSEAALREELERFKRDAEQDTTIDERDRYHEMADSLALAISQHFRVEIGEHSSMNCPWSVALEVLNGAYITDTDEGRERDTLQQRLTDAEKRISLVEGLLRKVHSDFRPNINGAEWNEIVDEALGVRPAGCCCPPKGHTGIWAAAMCPVHFGLNRPGVKP